MNFIQRFSFAWRVALEGKASALMVPTWKDGAPSYPEASFENMVKYGYRKNELIFACVSKTAATASFVRLEVKRDTDDATLDKHPLRALIAHPNPFMDEYDFWYSVVIFQKLAGGAYFEKERDRGGRVIALWPLRPDWVRPVQSQSAFIGGYEYAVPGEPVVRMRVEDVLDFKLFDPLNMYRGFPPAAVAGRVGDVDNATTDYLKLFMEQGGTPPGLLKTKSVLQPQHIAETRARWVERYGGTKNWAAPAILDQDLEYQAIGSSFKDMGFEVLDARSEARICMVLDVPPIIVGAKVGLDRATYSNYAEARQAWWEDSLTPLYHNFENVINNDLAPEFGPGLKCEFDFSTVPAFREQTDALHNRANASLLAGYVTINEAREIIGLEAIGEPGDIFLRPSGHAEVDLSGERINAPVMEPAATDPADDEPDDADADGKGAIGGMDYKAQAAPDDDERREFEELLRARLVNYFEGQRDRIAEAVAEQYAPMVGVNGTAH